MSFQLPNPKGLPTLTALPPQVYQPRKRGGHKPSRGSNNIESAVEQFIEAPYPRNDAPKAITTVEPARRISGRRVLLVAACALVTAFLVSPLSPVRALAGYDIAAAATLPVVGMIAVVWGTRRLR